MAYPAYVRRNERITGFVDAIWEWYAVHKRKLPWRDLNVVDPSARAYRILVSEVMLQQTQVDRVKVLYSRFLRRFPTLSSLARASNREVILAWRGMGYNSRALRLRDAARTIVERHSGIFPTEMNELESIKGLGHYTAAAIRNFAFNIPTPCIDTNIRRILHRTFAGPERADGTWEKDGHCLLKIAEEVLEEAMGQYDKYFTDAAAKRGSRPFDSSFRFTSLVAQGALSVVEGRGPRRAGRRSPEGEAAPLREKRARERKTVGLSLAPSNWHAALMDFGSLVQTKRDPKWDECPLTAQGLMVTTPRSFERIRKKSYALRPTPYTLTEPGREISGRFVPNRIVRGRIVEALRDAPAGLSLDALGRQVAADWSQVRHRAWLRKILASLERDTLVARSVQCYTLRD